MLRSTLNALDEAERLGDQWREARREMAHSILFVQLARSAESTGHRHYISIAQHARNWLANLKLAMRAEERMGELGVKFKRSN